MRYRLIGMFAIIGSFVVTMAAMEARAAGPGIFKPRAGARARPSTRVYRSYSVTPSTESGPESAAVAGTQEAVPPPMAAPSRPRRPSTSRPSYMRADSKAMGRFGQ